MADQGKKGKSDKGAAKANVAEKAAEPSTPAAKAAAPLAKKEHADHGDHADHAGHAHGEADHGHAHGHHAPNYKQYFTIFGVLAALTVLEVAIAYLPASTSRVLAMVGLAVTKAACVGFKFIRSESPGTRGE